MEKINIIGAGLAGSLLAVYLAKKGFEVNVYERRPDMRIADIGGGKSINLALSARGIYALKEVGLYDEIKKIAIPMYGRMIHNLDGSTQLMPYGKDITEYINSVSRAELNKKLLFLAEQYPSVKFHFNMRCISADLQNNEITFLNEQTKTYYKINSNITIAADGATSAVRMEMLKIPRFSFSQEYENYGYKELEIPPNANGSFAMETNALHIWPRGSFMLIALPNTDKSFTCTLFLAYDSSFGGNNSFEYLNSEQKVKDFFNEFFPDAFNLMPNLINNFFNNPLGSLMTVKCFPWKYSSNWVLLGDSAHAIVPFFGQGMNAAFEDCTYLIKCIEKFPDQWNKIFEEFQNIRKPNTDAIADLAQENFIEMRDLVSTKDFQLKKKIESVLYSKFPNYFIPKYSMVTFLRIPYSEALRRGKIQDEILNQLSINLNDIDNLDFELAEKLINSRLTELNINDFM
jgi:kynurenine 3-monooxygenase